MAPKRAFMRRTEFPKAKVFCCLSASLSLTDWEQVMLSIEWSSNLCHAAVDAE